MGSFTDLVGKIGPLALELRRQRIAQKEGATDRLLSTIGRGMQGIQQGVSSGLNRRAVSEEAEKSRVHEGWRDTQQQAHDENMEKLRQGQYIYDNLELPAPPGSGQEFMTFASKNRGEHEMNLRQYDAAWQAFYNNQLAGGRELKETPRYADMAGWVDFGGNMLWEQALSEGFFDAMGAPSYEDFGGSKEAWKQAFYERFRPEIENAASLYFRGDSEYQNLEPGTAEYDRFIRKVSDLILTYRQKEGGGEEEEGGGEDERVRRRRGNDEDYTQYVPFAKDIAGALYGQEGTMGEKLERVPSQVPSNVPPVVKTGTKDLLLQMGEEEELRGGYPPGINRTGAFASEQGLYDLIQEIMKSGASPAEKQEAKKYETEILQQDPDYSRRKTIKDALNDILGK